jgi:hypothetical protein
MVWNNSDSLYVKFGVEEAARVKGGQYSTLGALECTEIKIDYTDALSATAAIVGSVATSPDAAGSIGVQLPSGVRIEAVEVVAETAFTSSGTIGSSTFVLGLVRNDRTTVYDVDGFTTASFVGSVLDAAGERTYLTPGSTGAGAFIGTTLANSGYIVVANTAHATHPFTAGKAVVRIYWYKPQTIG